MIRFFVPGEPATQGSKRAFFNAKANRAMIVEDCKKNPAWRSDVRSEAMVAMGRKTPFLGPVALTLQFLMPRPKGHMGSGANSQMVRPSAPKFPAGKPDLTKLIRPVEDALRALCWTDDSQVCTTYARKDYAQPGCRTGVIIQIEPLVPDVAPHS